ncbi:zinc finger protein 37-like [Anopheles maculipalpis]|uniref:zinc finger protein 37-like n=1 Tax=Anopheles maculipalpis TaxID=1496333 RepID=UPI0021593D0B|nr:zinc finger protein 37-like [Anopheles maculipalpis]
MANVPQELSTICRFCLCQNVKLLLPIVKTLHTLLTIEDIERFTGIEIDPTNLSYTVCLECINKLKISTDFRSLCLTNDVRFKLLHSMLISSARSTPHVPIVCIDTSDDDDDPMDCDSFDRSFSGKARNREMLNAAMQGRKSPMEEIITIEDDHHYSANHIELGESSLGSEEEDSDPEDYKNTRLNPCYPVVYGAKKKLGKRKAHLCDACGKWATDLSYHYQTHATEPTFACPHCPTMTKQKNSLVSHIKAVHMKMITKTCEICGKGFIHHKTYRYHMRSHQSEGTTFECKECSKQFIHPSGLEQHMKKCHSIAYKLA